MPDISSLRRSIDKAAENLVQLLVEKGKKIACAESCTGGLVSAAITSVSGSSAAMDVSICTYANSAKMRYLGVPAETLDKYGAVSEQTALAMADGIRKAAESDIGISVTGIAGPTGGTESKPVGTVYVGISTKDSCEARLVFTDPSSAGNENAREYIRKSTVLAVLEWAAQKI